MRYKTITLFSIPVYLDTNGSNGNYYGSTGDSLSRANSLNNILGDTSTGARPEKRVHRYHLVSMQAIIYAKTISSLQLLVL